MVKEVGSNIEATNNKDTIEQDDTHCPVCKSALQKFLIQQNYAIVICPKETCGYPFNQEHTLDNLVYIDENEILEVAQERLSIRPKRS